MAERVATESEVGGFRGPQVCTLIGITYRQLDYWARTGLLRPSMAEARGSGTKRRYSYRDVLELKVIKQLLDAGISLQSARRAVECLRQDLGADLAAANLVLTGTRLGAGPLRRRGRRSAWPAARACSTSCRCPGWWTSWTPTSSASGATSVSRHGAGATVGRPPAPCRPERPGSDAAGARRPTGSRTRSTRRRRRCASPTRPSGSSPRCSTSTACAGSTSRWSSSSRWDDDGHADRRLPARLLAARPRLLRRADHGRPAAGDPEERQGPPAARALPRGRGDASCTSGTSWPSSARHGLVSSPSRAA